MSKRATFHAAMVSLGLLFFLPGAMAAEKYPAHEIQLIIPNPPGGFRPFDNIFVSFLVDHKNR